MARKRRHRIVIPDDVSVIDAATKAARKRRREATASWLANHHVARWVVGTTRNRYVRAREAIRLSGKVPCPRCGAQIQRTVLDGHLKAFCPNNPNSARNLRAANERQAKANRSRVTSRHDVTRQSPAKTPDVTRRNPPAPPAPKPTQKPAAKPAAASHSGGSLMSDNKRPLEFYRDLYRTANRETDMPITGMDALQAMVDLARALRPITAIADELYAHMTEKRERGGLAIDPRTLKAFAEVGGLVAEAAMFSARASRECAKAHGIYLEAEQSPPSTPLETFSSLPPAA